MRFFLSLLAWSLCGCGSAADPVATETSIPQLSPEQPLREDAESSEPRTVRPDASSTDTETQDEPASSSGLAEICSVDPTLCKPMTPEVIRWCACNPLKGRDRQKCLIDCMARERNKVDQQLKQLGP